MCTRFYDNSVVEIAKKYQAQCVANMKLQMLTVFGQRSFEGRDFKQRNGMVGYRNI
jgi:hypothetical protein